MQAAITAVAQSGACAVNELAIIGSMAAFESWKSTTTAAKTNSGQLWKTLANPSDQAAASRLGTPPRASLGVDICRSDMCQGGERRNAECGGQEEDRLAGKVVGNRSHKSCGHRIAE